MMERAWDEGSMKGLKGLERLRKREERRQEKSRLKLQGAEKLDATVKKQTVKEFKA